ncbi:MAG: hypothetical protein PHN49_06475 [Candidatus Omnitrophica bacterium]|nr:hypothetical protein [Candidatus Omnitrophota bacterium]MDD5671264.1 hypothetical protein [Candidatus Omnitrophota bacterium]
MRKVIFCLLIAVVVFPWAAHAIFTQKDLLKQPAGELNTTEISDKGRRLAELLDTLDVEHHWLAHQNVDWRTGEPDGIPMIQKGEYAHCSAFVAGATEKLGIYILRPPQHEQNLLANAQHRWLIKRGKKFGWLPVATSMEAQYRANQGDLVVISYQNPSRKKPGHIAIVRPCSKTAAEIQEEGPQIIQAGIENFGSAPMKDGFKHHLGASKKERILFFSHEIKI